MTLKTFLRAFGILAVILTLIPLIAADYWWIRMFDYPHIQLTLLTLAALAAYFLRFEIKSWRDYAFVGVLLICFLYQFVKIMPYTPLVPLEVGEPSENVDENSIKLTLTHTGLLPFELSIILSKEEDRLDKIEKHIERLISENIIVFF